MSGAETPSHLREILAQIEPAFREVAPAEFDYGLRQAEVDRQRELARPPGRPTVPAAEHLGGLKNTAERNTHRTLDRLQAFKDTGFLSTTEPPLHEEVRHLSYIGREWDRAELLAGNERYLSAIEAELAELRRQVDALPADTPEVDRLQAQRKLYARMVELNTGGRHAKVTLRALERALADA